MDTGVASYSASFFRVTEETRSRLRNQNMPNATVNERRVMKNRIIKRDTMGTHAASELPAHVPIEE